MMQIDKLTLVSGIDLPFPELKVNIHQPTIREISYIGEMNFYEALSIITIDAETLIKNSKDFTEQDKSEISKMSNFKLFLTMVNSQPNVKVSVFMLFTLLFPNHTLDIQDEYILLTNIEKNDCVLMDENIFTIFQKVLKRMFCLNGSTSEEEFNPAGERAKEIIEKIKKGREKVEKQRGTSKSKTKNFLSKYISGLGIGSNSLNILNVLDLTLYQLFDQLERFQLYSSFNIAIDAKMAGAKDVEDIDWLKDIEK